MDGHEFESYCAQLLEWNGYYNVQVTKGSGDFGIDIIADSCGNHYGFQCKRYSGAVGPHAVQEVYTGLKIYNCTRGVVITNSSFTAAAKKCAAANDIELWDGNTLKRLADNYFQRRYHQENDRQQNNSQKNNYQETFNRNSYQGNYKRQEYTQRNQNNKDFVSKKEKTDIFISLLIVLFSVIAICSFRNIFFDSKEKNTITQSPAVTIVASSVPEATPFIEEITADKTILYNRYSDLSVELTLVNESEKDYLVELYGNGVNAIDIFIPAYSKTSVPAPVGTYDVRLATGSKWVDLDKLFGDSTKTYVSNEPVVYPYSTEQEIILDSSLTGFSEQSWQ